jgi:glycosyltransferase involved in cell wall biosynthesis
MWTVRRMDDPLPRIAFVSHTAGCGGGSESLLLELVTALKDQSVCESRVLLPGEGDLATMLREAGVSVACAKYEWWCSGRVRDDRRSVALAGRQALYHARRIWPSATSILLALRDFLPDVVVSNTCVTPAGALAAMRMRVPHVWLANEYGREDFHFTFFFGYGLSMRLLAASSAVIVAVSSALAAALARYTLPRKIEILHPACLTPSGSPLEPRVKGEPLRLVLLGRGVPGKGVEAAILAVGIARSHGIDAQLRIVGHLSPAAKASFRSLSVATGVEDDVSIVGDVENTLTEIDRAHVALMCSRSEAFGRVTVECLRRGRPVIGTRSGGTPELVEDYVTGLLYDPGDYHALASQIEFLASSSEELIMFSRAALERNVDRFVLSDYVEEFSRILQRARHDGPVLRRRPT